MQVRCWIPGHNWDVGASTFCKDKAEVLGPNILQDKTAVWGPIILHNTTEMWGPNILQDTAEVLGPNILQDKAEVLGLNILQDKTAVQGPIILHNTTEVQGPNILQESWDEGFQDTTVTKLWRDEGLSQSCSRRCLLWKEGAGTGLKMWTTVKSSVLRLTLVEVDSTSNAMPLALQVQLCDSATIHKQLHLRKRAFTLFHIQP